MLVYPRATNIFILDDHLFTVKNVGHNSESQVPWGAVLSQQCCDLLLIFLHSKSFFSLGKLQYVCHKAEILLFWDSCPNRKPLFQ